MHRVPQFLIVAASLDLFAAVGHAQPPDDQKGDGAKANAKIRADAFIARMMAFDKNRDGKLTRDEITDERLLRLFDQADTNHDGVVTKEELAALAAKMTEDEPRGGPGGRPGGGPGGRGGPSGGAGGPGGFGPPPQPGQILPEFLQTTLNLTPEQKKQINNLQKEVDAKLDKILTAEQKKQLKEMPQRGPGGPGGPGGGPRRPGGPGGPTE